MVATQEDTSNLVFAKDLARMKKSTSYQPFKKGFFHNVPEMAGYIYQFKVTGAKIVLIIDTANSTYNKSYYHNEGVYFLVFKAVSIDSFIAEIFTHIEDLVDMINRILDNEQANADERAGGVPHGYKIDKNGEIVVDAREASKVRKIYKLYSKYEGGIRRIANELKTNFSHVREVLHDYRYEKMTIKIIPEGVLKKVRQLMDMRRKNRTT